MIICTPPSSHVAIGRQALDGGSHLLIEKPIAHTLEGLEDLLKAADAARKAVLTAYNWRYWPPLLLAERLLKEDRIGTVRAARTEYPITSTPPVPG